MKLILATLLSLTFAMCTPVHADFQTNFYGKPVLCAPPEDNMMAWQQLKDDGMVPLMGFPGNSFLNDGQKFKVNYFIAYDQEEQKVAVVEVQPTGFTCIIAGGTGNVIFDTEHLRDLIGWEELD